VKKEQNGRKSLRRLKPTVGCNANKRRLSVQPERVRMRTSYEAIVTGISPQWTDDTHRRCNEGLHNL
jgi:hypothetical protein